MDDAMGISKAVQMVFERKKTMPKKAGWPAGRPCAEETRVKISQAMTGKTHTKETRQKMSAIAKRRAKLARLAEAELSTRATAA
jgi:hypothetical protein